MVLGIPCNGLVDHLLRYHINFTGILIPSVVAIEADDVQELGLRKVTKQTGEMAILQFKNIFRKNSALTALSSFTDTAMAAVIGRFGSNDLV